MANSNNNLDYQSINSLKDLRYQRRMLSSRIEHQEIMISYQVRSIRDAYSPANLAFKGFESLATKSRSVAVAFRVFNTLRSFISRIKR